LGEFEVFDGDYRKLFDSPATYEKVARADLQKAAALIFQKNHRTVGVLTAPPEGKVPPAGPTPSTAVKPVAKP
jgi:zinc protease